MKVAGAPAYRRIVIALACTAGISLAAGCGHKDEIKTQPQQIKAAMGGHYSPDALAQGRAYQAAESQKQAALMQSKQSGGDAKATAALNP